MVPLKIEATVGHVGIEVTNLERSKKFYKTLFCGLGLKVHMDSNDGLGLGNDSFSVWIGELRESRVRRKAPTGEEFVVADHLAVVVPDKDAVYAIESVMKKGGYNPLFPCEEHPYFEPGYFAASFLDPDNYVIEVYTRKKQA